MTRTTTRAYDMTKRVEAVEGTRRRIGAAALGCSRSATSTP